MKQRLTSRPTPAVSAITAVLGVLMVIFGIIAFSKTEHPPGAALIFFMVWVLAGVGVVVYHLLNATRPKGLPTEIIEVDKDISESKSSADRLQELEDLRARQLISDAEYQGKRQEILGNL